MQDLNHRSDVSAPVRPGHDARRQEQRRRRVEGTPKRTITLGDDDMGRLADVLSKAELSALIKAEQRMQQIRVRNRLSGSVPESFWDAYETATELRHTALKRMVDHYAYSDSDTDAR